MTLKDLHAFETGLDPHPANFVPLSPVSFLSRAASALRIRSRSSMACAALPMASCLIAACVSLPR